MNKFADQCMTNSLYILAPLPCLLYNSLAVSFDIRTFFLITVSVNKLSGNFFFNFLKHNVRSAIRLYKTTVKHNVIQYQTYQVA